MVLQLVDLVDLPRALQALQATVTTMDPQDPQEARHMAITTTGFITVPDLMPTALVVLLVVLTAGPKTCPLHTNMQLEIPGAPSVITMDLNTAIRQKGLDIDLVVMDLDMVPECIMVDLLADLDRKDLDIQVIIMNHMARFMGTMDTMDLPEGITDR